ncbi:MAG: dipeptidase [Bacillota bacterium]|nr:dipeptidase [Bacillota bacterium]MDW7677370.1 dipeptidase [Bacillota bacterium]
MKHNKRSRTLLVLLMLSLAIPAAWALPANLSAEEMHMNAIVVDTHNDTMMKVVDETSWFPVIDLGSPAAAEFQLNLVKAREGGLKVAFYAAYTDYRTDAVFTTARTNSRSLALINALHWTAAQNSDTMMAASSLREIKQGLKADRHVAVASLEGMYQFVESNAMELLHQYYDLGVRMAGIVWNTPNSLGAGNHVANDAPDAGLTELGKKVIREMNRLGIIVDMSHMNEKTFFDTMAVVQAPVIASHSGVDGVRPHERNLSDAQLLALKENGGVVQINFWATTVADIGQVADIAKLVDHIDYVVQFIGVDHVGLGSDFDGAPMPVDLPNAAFLPGITAELVNRGYSQEDNEKILGGNSLRVFREVEAHAQKVTSPRGLGITILPDLQPGEIIQDKKPLLTASVIGHGGHFIETADYRVIVDGMVYEPEFDGTAGVLALQMPTELLGRGKAEESGNFHVVTFEGVNTHGIISRETVIFYVW